MPGLFEDLRPSPARTPIAKGALISFRYPASHALSPNVIHDPTPMLIVTDVWPPKYIRGVNLNYLTFPDIKTLLLSFAGNQSFGYSQNVRMKKLWADAFRVYSLGGVMTPKRLDSDWLMKILAGVRSFEPGEIEKIRASVEQQIKARLQVRAGELTSYEQQRAGQPQPPAAPVVTQTQAQPPVQAVAATPAPGVNQ